MGPRMSCTIVKGVLLVEKTSDFEEGQLKTKTDTKSDRHEEKSLAKSSDNSIAVA